MKLGRQIFSLSASIDTTTLEYSQLETKVTWQAILQQYPLEIIIVILMASGLTVLLLTYLLMIKSKNETLIQSIMYRDSLTGLWNFNKFCMEVTKCLQSAENSTYALVYTDVNQFKLINDTMGFGEGDNLLCMLGNLILENMNCGEYCARVSADQFVMLYHYDTWENLVDRTAELNQRLFAVKQDSAKPYYPLLAFGVYIVDKTETMDVSLMLDFANYALKRAKSTRVSKTVLYDEKMRKRELKWKQLSESMESALEDGEFCPYFQPKVNMATGAVVGAEALVRWIKPDKTVILPGDFIPLFEQNGFVVEIDMYMFEQVCRKIRKWLDEGKNVPTISCNFSRLHFHNIRFPFQILEIAQKYNVPTCYLDLEITESIAMEDMERVQKHLERLKEFGFLISIDDFGSGYSSLGLLQELDADVLKLDRSFFKQGIPDYRDQVIIRAITTVAHDLDMLVVCEGVETEEQSKMLLAMGCYVAQSFYYAKPMPAEEFEKLLKCDKKMIHET